MITKAIFEVRCACSELTQWSVNNHNDWIVSLSLSPPFPASGLALPIKVEYKEGERLPTAEFCFHVNHLALGLGNRNDFFSAMITAP